ncbi:MAG: MopE-related protein [Polyangiaceae bacterium]
MSARRTHHVSLLGTALAIGLSLAAAACNDAAYCFTDCGGHAGSGGTTTTGTAGAGATIGGGFVGGGGTGGGCDADLMSDVDNCGTCGHVCVLAGATAKCMLGECAIDACLEGDYDLDGKPENGCEYACIVPVPGPEQCNGLDDDCDGKVDSDDPDLLPPANFCTLTPGTPCENTQILCNGEQGWSCSYPAGVEVVAGFVRLTETQCDGIDGNCDGQVDEWFADLGQPCEDMGIGVCKDHGLIQCDPQNPQKTFCDLSFPPDAAQPGPEACNGLDDDCDGFVDNAMPESAFEMEPIPGANPVVKVDRYEASRPDATMMKAGIVESVACSKATVVPWTSGSYSEAEAACAARGPGYRLCAAPELEKACRGAANTLYPYGAAYAPLTCNGADQPMAALQPTGSLPMCVVSGATVYDLSGNAAEWTSTQTNAAAAPNRIFQLHGGSYLSPSLGLACTIELAPRAAEQTLLPNIGFRCCKD